MCQFDGKSNTYYTNLMYRMISQAQTNINVGVCPYPEDFYYLRNLTLNVNAFKMIPIPDNIYKVIANVFINEGNSKIWMVNCSIKFQLFNENDARKKQRSKKIN